MVDILWRYRRSVMTTATSLLKELIQDDNQRRDQLEGWKKIPTSIGVVFLLAVLLFGLLTGAKCRWS